MISIRAKELIEGVRKGKKRCLYRRLERAINILEGKCPENMFRLPHRRFGPGSIGPPSGACTWYGSVDSEVVPCLVHAQKISGVGVSDTCSPTFAVGLVVHPLAGVVLK